MSIDRSRRLHSLGRSLALLPVAAALVSCGGGGISAERLAEEQWIDRADAICSFAEEEIEALVRPDLADQDGLAAYMAGVADIGQRELDELRALSPPLEAETDFDALLDISQKQVEVARNIGDAASQGDATAITELAAEAETLQARSNGILARYPFDVCGAAPS